MRAADPVVTRTNHGSARNVICEPSDETTSATSSGRRRGARSSASCGLRRGRRARRRGLASADDRDDAAMPTVCVAANADEHGLRAERVQDGPGADDAERLRRTRRA